MAIYWTQELEIGVAPIDRQHQELFERIDALINACQGGRCREEVEGLLDFLQEYVLVHFLEEEELMRLFDYPELPGHAREHTGFSEHLAELIQGFAEKGLTLPLLNDLNATVVDWLYEHIGGRDRALGQWLGRRAGASA